MFVKNLLNINSAKNAMVIKNQGILLEKQITMVII